MNYVNEFVLDDQTFAHIKNRLRKLKVRKRYKKALIYYPKKGKYLESEKRHSLKATFFDTQISNWVKDTLPHNIEISEYEHIDILHYSQGQYFKEHTDYVNTFPNSAIQVSIIIGLRNTHQGGTTIRVGDETTTYGSPIRKGGVLVFDSMLPHSGEYVVGEKEVLVLTGYLFPERVPSTSWETHYCDKIRCLAVHTERRAYYDEDGGEYDNERYHTVHPCYYLYQNRKCIATYDTQYEATCYRMKDDSSPLVDDLHKEQLRLMKDRNRQHIADSAAAYPILKKMLQRKNVIDCFHQCRTNKQHHETVYRYEREFCNGGDDYDTVEIPDMFVSTHCKHFSIAVYNKNYYAFWLHKIFDTHCSGSRIMIDMIEMQAFLDI